MSRWAYLALAMLILTVGSSWTEHVNDILGLLANLVAMLVVFIAPVLLLYGFSKSTLDVIRACGPVALLPLVGSVEGVARTVDQLFATVSALFLIVIPFTILLMFWKAFTKLIKV